jgi:hypothetical protein
MTFHVYPDPQTDPLSVNPAPASPTEADITLAPFGQLTGPTDSPGSYNKMMVIRVAVFEGVSAPTLFLKAGSGHAAQATPLTNPVYRDAAMTQYVGDVKLVTIGEQPNVFQIRMEFDQNSTETWQLGILNRDASPRQFTWVVAGTAAGTVDDMVTDSAQPWVVVSPGDLTYHSLIADHTDESVTVLNKGTGPLNVTGVTPALPAGLAITTALPVVVPPSGSAVLKVTLTAPATPPGPDGVIPATVSVTANDTTASTSAGHNKQLAITATIQALEVVLLLDNSGSMSWDPQGKQLAVGDPNARWGELKDAAGHFLDMLVHFGGNGRFGIAGFPAGDPTLPPGLDIFPMAAIPTAVAGTDVMKPAKDAIARVNPTGGTPMGDGLNRVLLGTPEYFHTDTVSVEAGRRWLVLMSDGANNSGTHNPVDFAGAPLVNSNIALFAVAYGIPGFSDVNHDLMQTLATGSVGGGSGMQYVEVKTPGTTPEELTNALRTVLKSGLTDTSSPRDPAGVFVIGGGPVLHEVTITPFDTKAAFVVNWNTPDPNRLRLELLTPTCELITPENAGSGRFAHVTFRGGDRANAYFIDPEFLADPRYGDGGEGGDGGVDITGGSSGGSGRILRPRFGTWTLVITSPPPIIIGIAETPAEGVSANWSEGEDLEHYSYDAIVESTLRLRLASDQASYFAGDPITVSARLTGGGLPITDASVTLSTTTPAQSFATWLATLVVPADALARAKQILEGQDASPLLVKQLAAQLAGLVFDPGQRQVALTMTDPDGTGTYQATFVNTDVPEHYTFYVTARGVTQDDVVFRREAKLETFVQVRPEPAFTALDVHQVQAGQSTVTISPRDRFGNVLLVDPATTLGFGVLAQGATLQGALANNLDGTYTQVVTYDPKTNPAIGLQFGGQPVITPRPTPAVGNLRYADHVVSYEPGPVKAANQHADARAALGTVVGKPDGTFVSLGGQGKLVVTLDKLIIVAAADNDVTVFVAPDTDLRSYRVEAFVAGHRQWVTLGESLGVTQSFGLRAAGLTYALAIRVTDTSGRVRGADAKPLSSPGVSIRGIGALKIGKDLPCGRDQLPDWFPWPKSGKA